MTPPCQTNTVDLNMNEAKTDSHFTAIQNFYNGTNVFITGGTGDSIYAYLYIFALTQDDIKCFFLNNAKTATMNTKNCKVFQFFF